MEKERIFGIVTAGGKGLRMGGELPKQFLKIGGRMILSRTLDAMAGVCSHLVLVLPESHISFWKDAVESESSPVPSHHIIPGGETRFHSVLNAIEFIESKYSDYLDANAIVAVHDGVRPYVKKDTIERCVSAASSSGASVPVMPVTESLRILRQDGSSGAVDRSRYYNVQTPQCFNALKIISAYNRDYSPLYTDDASVYEACFGQGSVSMVEGNWENIKITRPSDMAFIPDFIKQE